MKQTTYNPSGHKGNQPVRVLSLNVTEWFENTYPQFKEDILEKAIKEKGLYEEIRLIEREEKIGDPAFVGSYKVISIEESFLSYLWSLSYSLVVLFDENIHKPQTIENYTLDSKAQHLINEALKLFDYGFSLMYNFNYWDKNLPNPEEFDPAANEYIEKANGVYLNAVNYVLLHELAHVDLGHIDNDILNSEKGIKTPESEIKQDEYHADKYAFERIMQGSDYLTNKHTVSVGIIAGICSFIFFSAEMGGGDHPDPDERLKIALESLDLEEEDNLWGMACLAFKLWSIKHKIDLGWPVKVDTYRDLFYLTLTRIEALKQ
ncbi:phage exclusion protein Lit family protein [uncultured Pontibacter sp.]|uniref:phage exclusion protein Lit family protein n=1 Tax=uncultured Pontibacter sp. TaxID=453356 RepID=UPI002625DDA7|nr:phage exclusion protein Lit family protein [uncultured Pontibacter sp.]